MLVAGLQPVLAEPARTPAPPAAVLAGAGSVEAVRALAATLRIPALAAVMRDEGVSYGDQLRDELLAGKGGTQWSATVGHIYDPDRMSGEIGESLTRSLADQPEVVRAATDFFAGPTGARILGLELEARRALLDEATEAAAQKTFGDMEVRATPRLEALRRFAAVNDLIEMNVMGALNANLAFYKGMADGGAFDSGMSEADMLAEVWSQEDQVRTDAETWLWPYLALAYQPLSDEEMQAYQNFSESTGGRKLNAALFEAFDASFTRISRELGLAAARIINGEEI